MYCLISVSIHFSDSLLFFFKKLLCEDKQCDILKLWLLFIVAGNQWPESLAECYLFLQEKDPAEFETILLESYLG